MKRVILIVLALSLIFSFSACKPKTSGADEEMMVNEYYDGWERTESPALTYKEKELFKKAFEGVTDISCEPIAYIAFNTLHHYKDRFLARMTSFGDDPSEKFAIVEIAYDNKGNAEDFDIRGSDIETNINGLTGGWELPDVPEVEDELKEAFETAAKDKRDFHYEPIALVSTQVVSGMNYCLLCESTLEVDGLMEPYMLAYLYVDLDGNPSLTDYVELFY